MVCCGNDKARLFGILNGVDYEEWNTMNESIICKARIQPRGLAEKKINKARIAKGNGLAAATDMPLFGTITRLAEQKGMDIQLAALEEMLSTDMQFVLLGSGSPAYEHGYHELARRFPNKVRRDSVMTRVCRTGSKRGAIFT